MAFFEVILSVVVICGSFAGWVSLFLLAKYEKQYLKENRNA